jgi:hypothetical protein
VFIPSGCEVKKSLEIPPVVSTRGTAQRPV